GMTPTTRLFPSGQATSDVDRFIGGEKPLLFSALFFTETVDFDEGDWVRGPKLWCPLYPPLPRGF
ncbi:MAG: hypothetical protein WCD87_16760, partial [Pseudolabrys sp.]